jgi:hypothetical protein
MLITIPLLGVLAAAAWHDVKAFRIPNVLTLCGILAGVGLNTTLPDGIGVTLALAGFALALFGLLPLYLLRIWGAGDAKVSMHPCRVRASSHTRYPYCSGRCRISVTASCSSRGSAPSFEILPLIRANRIPVVRDSGSTRSARAPE